MMAVVFCSARKTCSGCRTGIVSSSTRSSKGRNGRAFKAARRLDSFIQDSLMPPAAEARTGTGGSPVLPMLNTYARRPERAYGEDAEHSPRGLCAPHRLTRYAVAVIGSTDE